MAEKVLKDKIQQAFQGIFDHYHEKLFVAYYHYSWLVRFFKERVYFKGEERLKEALKEDNGVILVTGHFGAVEFLPAFLALNNYPTSMICRFQTERLRISLHQRAHRVGLDLIDADEGNIALNALKALKQGRILITECDEFEEWRPDPHRQVFFLNCRLPSDRTLDLLRKRSGAPVLTAFIKREGKKTYSCNLTTVVNDASPVNLPLIEMCLLNLEMALEANPEHWYQWKKFGKIIKSRLEVGVEGQEIGGMAPEMIVSCADQT
jgi:lauroyl/myristoyl acyltransferase